MMKGKKINGIKKGLGGKERTEKERESGREGTMTI